MRTLIQARNDRLIEIGNARGRAFRRRYWKVSTSALVRLGVIPTKGQQAARDLAHQIFVVERREQNGAGE